MTIRSSSDSFEIVGLLMIFFLALVPGFVAAAGWVTHVIICIKASMFLFLIIGCVFAPVGVIHGIGHWFGAW